jgi:cation transport protein ChaC
VTAAYHWAFGYASLMWNPGFAYTEARPAHVFGYHRALCVYSFLYRGTHEQPGIVAGLRPGGSCRGMAFKVPTANWAETEKYLLDREMVYGVYIPRWMTAEIGGQKVNVYGFCANPENEQYAGDLPVDQLADLVRNGQGVSGTGTEYLENVLAGLAKLGIRDRKLEKVLDLARS